MTPRDYITAMLQAALEGALMELETYHAAPDADYDTAEWGDLLDAYYHARAALEFWEGVR